MTSSLDREDEADTMPNNDLVTKARWGVGGQLEVEISRGNNDVICEQPQTMDRTDKMDI